MINGITVLAEEFYVNKVSIIILVLSIVLISWIGILLIGASVYYRRISYVIAIILSFSILLSAPIHQTINYYKDYKNEKKIYTVTIDDDISWKEFNEKYEILEQKGKLYKIIIKENQR